MSSPPAPAAARPRPALLTCPKCDRSIILHVSGAATCLPCATRMQPLEKRRARSAPSAADPPADWETP